MRHSWQRFSFVDVYPPHCDIAILLKNDYLNTYQTMLDAMHDVNVTYINAHHTFLQKKFWDGPFYLTVTRQLARYVGSPHVFSVRYIDKAWYRYMRHYLRIQKVKLKRFILKIWKKR